MIEGTDIVFVYSGGSTNNDPDLSLGGEPSAFQILGTVNNLFDNVSDAEATSGGIDFRCFYFFNNNETSTFKEVVMFVESEIEGGASIEIGITRQDDVQRINIPQPVSAGSLTLSFEGDEFVWDFDPDLAIWGTNLATDLNALDQLSDVEVTVSVVSGDNVFDIIFTGSDGSRNQELLELISNDLDEAPSITISKITEGAQMNFVTPAIPVDTAEPDNVGFQFTDSETVIDIGDMQPLDGFPVWVKRTTLPGTQSQENDGFTVRLSGKAF